MYYFHNSNDFRSILDGGWLRLTRDFHPLRVSQITLFACDGSRPNEAVSTLGLRLGKRIIVLIYGSWPQARHSLLCARWPLALYLLSYGGVLASSLPHGFSFRAVYQTYPVDLGNDLYPAILTDEEYRCAASTKPVVGSQFDGKAKSISLASARFNALGSEDYETMRIQYILTRTEQNGGLDIELLRQITSAILIHPNGAVSLKLKNGQIIEKE